MRFGQMASRQPAPRPCMPDNLVTLRTSIATGTESGANRSAAPYLSGYGVNAASFQRKFNRAFVTHAKRTIREKATARRLSSHMRDT